MLRLFYEKCADIQVTYSKVTQIFRLLIGELR
jgi:hypothetical protein